MKKSVLLVQALFFAAAIFSQQQPNIVFIYTDDLGYGDLSCNGATQIQTPHIDRLAKEGIRFTNAHATSATCTPSRFSLLTGTYAWRKKGTGIAPGDASLIVPTDKITLPGVLKKAGYATAIVGKWHLGLGGPEGPDWNGVISPGPREIGFDYSFILPATVDRVPCVFVENGRVVNLDPSDPIQVSYDKKVGDWPTGKEHPELLKLEPSHGHDQTIVNGISRIGYMTGGKKALWKDEDIADVITEKSKQFMISNRSHPFFLLITTHDIHVPRTPHERFAGKSGLGARGDVILQLDATVGEINRVLDSLGLRENTLIIFSSDNGPVVDDGYQDLAVEKLGQHRPSGNFRGGKYSAFEAGTRVPFIVSWPRGMKKNKTSDALFSQIDMLASLAALTGQQLADDEATDSFNQLPVLLGQSKKDRPYLVEQANALSLVSGHWKYIEPKAGPAKNTSVNIELGNAMEPQLYDLSKDSGEQHILATKKVALVQELAALLETIRNSENERRRY